ncbi:hypothetical protein BH11ARM1_BH11ARM1_13770 [soil metagenome]
MNPVPLEFSSLEAHLLQFVTEYPSVELIWNGESFEIWTRSIRRLNAGLLEGRL